MWKKVENGHRYEFSIKAVALVPGPQFLLFSIFPDGCLLQTRAEESLEIRGFPSRFVLFVDGCLVFEEDFKPVEYWLDKCHWGQFVNDSHTCVER